MRSIPPFAALASRALWLDGDAYWSIKNHPQAVAHSGGRLVVLLGLALGAAEFLRTLLGWALLPDLPEVQRVLAQALPNLPLLGRWSARAALWLGPDSALWRALRWGWPTAARAPLRAAFVPLALLGEWFIWGCLSHGAARLLGGGGAWRDTLRCASLATSPCLLLLCPFVPALSLGTLGIWAWVLAGRWLALRAAHGLDGWRAFWATLAPALLLGWLGLIAVTALLFLGRVG